VREDVMDHEKGGGKKRGERSGYLEDKSGNRIVKGNRRVILICSRRSRASRASDNNATMITLEF